MGKRTMKLATRGKRLGAAVIDAVIPAFAYIVFIIAAALSAKSNAGPAYGYGFEEEFGYGYSYGYEMQSNTGWIMVLPAILGLLLLAYVIVECVFFAKSRSIGKAILGLQVVSSTDGRPIGFWKMFFREVIVKQASNVFLLGFIWILIDEKNRGWHDKILDTYVVDLKESANLNVANSAAPAGIPAATPVETPAAPSTGAPAAPPAEMPPAAEEIVTEIELTPVPAEALAETAPAAPEVQLPKKPVIRLDVDEDE